MSRRARSPRGVLLIIGLGLVSCAGCRFGGVPAPGPWLGEAGGGDLPWLGRLGVAPVRLGFDPAGLHGEDPTRHAVPPDPAVLRREVLEALTLCAAFARVEARGDEEAGPEAVAQLAWEARDDHLLELEVQDYFQEYLGHTSYVRWFLIYTSVLWPAWYVPVDRYGTGLRVHVRLRGSLGGMTPLLEKTYRVRPGAAAQELTPDDRELAGFLDLGALWSVETSLEDANWQAIEKAVGPHARRAFLRELRADVEGALCEPLQAADAPPTAFDPLRKRFALVVGVENYADPSLGAAPHAAADAAAVAELWSQPPGGGLTPDRELRLLLDAQATRSAVLEVLRELAGRTSRLDELLVYFAGKGATAPSAEGAARPLLLPHDGERARLAASALSLAELGALLAEAPAERVLLVVDASFAAAGPGRRSLGGQPPLSEAELRAVLPADGALGLALAASPDQAAHPLRAAEAGLFSYFLLRGLRGEGDADGDGRVSAAELGAFVGTRVASRAGLEGFVQEPFLLGLDAHPLGWPR